MAPGNSITDREIIPKLCLICKYQIRINPVLCTDIRERKNIICHGRQNLLRELCHIGLYGDFRITGTVNRQSLYKHADCILQSGIISSIINSCKKTLLGIGISAHENAEYTCKQNVWSNPQLLAGRKYQRLSGVHKHRQISSLRNLS